MKATTLILASLALTVASVPSLASEPGTPSATSDAANTAILDATTYAMTTVAGSMMNGTVGFVKVQGVLPSHWYSLLSPEGTPRAMGYATGVDIWFHEVALDSPGTWRLFDETLGITSGIFTVSYWHPTSSANINLDYPIRAVAQKIYNAGFLTGGAIEVNCYPAGGSPGGYGPATRVAVSPTVFTSSHNLHAIYVYVGASSTNPWKAEVVSTYYYNFQTQQGIGSTAAPAVWSPGASYAIMIGQLVVPKTGNSQMCEKPAVVSPTA